MKKKKKKKKAKAIRGTNVSVPKQQNSTFTRSVIVVVVRSMLVVRAPR